LKRSNIQKTLVKDGKIKVVENSRFMMEAKRKDLDRRQRQKEESTPVVKQENIAVSSSSSSHGRVGGSCRRCDPAACGRA
jgi:hypothetical protein